MRSTPLLATVLGLALCLPAAAATLDIPRPEAPSLSKQQTATGLPVRPVLRTGAAVPLQLEVRASDWRPGDDGEAVWRLTLASADASYIGLKLEQPQLPEGTRLGLIGDNGKQRGPYSRDDLNSQGALWIPFVPGAQADLVLHAPAASTSAVQLGAAELHYGLRPLDGAARTKAQGDAGDCHNDVACPAGAGWDQSIRSTVRVLIGSQLICTGVLLNNTSGDGDPLLVTADHCGIRADGDSEGFPAESVVALFNFQRRECGSNENVARDDEIRGETLLYRDRESDTALIRLSEAPPADFGAVYAGWDASGSGAGSGSGVHHPSGDLKKISLFDEALQRQRVTITDGALVAPRNQEVESWEVTWSDGVTEPGSSGSGIWNPQQRLLGVLSGGTSACGSDGLLLGIGASPEDPGPDFYGRLAVAFNNGGELGTPLRAFLDPNGSGAQRANARGAGAPSGALSGDGGSSGGSFGLIMLALLGIAAFGRASRPRDIPRH